jgi:hypothetical protein
MRGDAAYIRENTIFFILSLDDLFIISVHVFLQSMNTESKIYLHRA